MSNNPKALKTTWQVLGHKVLASILVDHGAVFPVLDVLGNGLHWFMPKQAQVWAGVLQCVEEGIPPTVEAVQTRCGVDGYVQAIANQWNDGDNRNVVYHAEELRRLGGLAEFRHVGREILEVTDPGDLVPSVEYASNRLSGVLAATARRNGAAASVSASAWAKVEKFRGQGIPTGMGWFDEITGGLWTGMNCWMAAAYKSGKSSLMRNLVLAALGAGHAVDVYCAEGSREMFTLDCQAMIATRLLCERGERDKKQLRLSGLFIKRVWRSREAVLRKEEWEALEEARTEWEGYNARVWDTSDGIRNLGTLRHRVQKSKFDHGSLIHWCDYSQLFGSGRTLYERQSAVALAVQEIATDEDVMMGMLTQRNEAAIGGGNTYSAGVKGGGDASAAADFLLMPKIDLEVPGFLDVKLKFSRHTAMGQGRHAINPSSGLILDRWQRNPPLLSL